MYYTFRQTFVDVYQCTKWDDDRKEPLDTYTVEHKGRFQKQIKNVLRRFSPQRGKYD